MNKHIEIDELAQYMDFQLEGTQRQAIEEHFKHCQQCADAYNCALVSRDALSATLPLPENFANNLLLRAQQRREQYLVRNKMLAYALAIALFILAIAGAVQLISPSSIMPNHHQQIIVDEDAAKKPDAPDNSRDKNMQKENPQQNQRYQQPGMKDQPDAAPKRQPDQQPPDNEKDAQQQIDIQKLHAKGIQSDPDVEIRNIPNGGLLPYLVDAEVLNKLARETIEKIGVVNSTTRIAVPSFWVSDQQLADVALAATDDFTSVLNNSGLTIIEHSMLHKQITDLQISEAFKQTPAQIPEPIVRLGCSHIVIGTLQANKEDLYITIKLYNVTDGILIYETTNTSRKVPIQ